MTVRKLATGKWLLECYPSGADGKRIRKQFVTKGEALSHERRLMNQNVRLEEGKVHTRLSELITRWYELHGKTLASGKDRLAKLELLCERLEDPIVSQFNKNDFAQYRKRRLNGEWQAKGRSVVKEATINREQSYLHAVFSELKRLGEWEGVNPLDGVRHFREKENELAFLYPEEIKRLLDACEDSSNPDLASVVRICLATGSRWSEAEELNQSQVLPGRITFARTKSKKNRTVPISSRLMSILPKKRGRLFSSCYDAFKFALKRAGIELPQGQRTHVLRHTFASHFMMNGGNILVLQQILGHSTINMTMRYAHFAPNHLDAAVSLNPLDRLENGDLSGGKNQTSRSDSQL